MNPPKDQITISEIADSFADRLERGERPSIESYKQRYPELAEEIDAVLPALVMLGDVESQPPAPKLAVDDSIPSCLGDYEIIREVGRGGMGIVFEAQHTTMRRRVALKVLPKSSNEKPNHLSRFLTEARSAGKLHHTNIVPVFDIGEDHGLHYYAMQFINGHNLDGVINDIRRLKESSKSGEPAQVSNTAPAADSHLVVTLARTLIHGENRNETNTSVPQAPLKSFTDPIDQASETCSQRANEETDPDVSSRIVNEALQGSNSSNTNIQISYHKRVALMGVQIAQALEHAHLHDVLHRDIKPANLILDTEGTVWVTDFGLAKLEAATITQTGDIVGTLRYMAPERFKGQADARSDIYSLGLTLYELAVLQCAVDGDQAKILSNASTRTFTPPSKIDPNIPADLEIIILKSLEIEPSRRYQSAQEMAEDLNLFLADRPIRARRVSLFERGMLVCKRNPLAATLTACIAVLLLLLAFGGLSFALYQSEQVKAEIQNRKKAQRGQYESKLDQAKLLRMSGRLGQQFASIQAIKDATDLLPELDLSQDDLVEAKRTLRNEAIAALLLSDLHSTSECPIKDGWGRRQRISFNDDMTLCAMGNENGETQIIKLGAKREEDQVIQTLRSPRMMSSRIQLSPDGRFLGTLNQDSTHAVYQNVMLYLWDLENPEKPIFEQAGGVDFQFSNDSCLLAFTDVDKANIYSIPERKIVKTIKEIRPRYIRFSHDRKQLAMSDRSDGKSIEIWDISETPKLKHKMPVKDGITSLAWDSRQQILAAGTLLGNMSYWVGGFEDPPQTIEVQQNGIGFLHIHPTQHLVLCDTADATIRVVDLDAKRVTLEDDRSNYLLFNGFSPQGQIGYASNVTNTWGIWEFAQPNLTVLKHKQKHGTIAHFHPVHCQIIARSTSNSIEFFDCIRGKALGEIMIDPDITGGNFCFDHTGKWIYASGTHVLRWPINIQLSEHGIFQFSCDKHERIASFECTRITASTTADLLAFSNKMAVVVWNAETKKTTQLGRHMGVQHMHFSADNKWLFTGTQLGRGVCVWDLEKGKKANTILADERSVQGTPHPTKPNHFVTSGGTIREWEIGDADNPVVKPYQSTFGSRSRYSPDGKILAVNTAHDTVTLYDVESDQELAVIKTLGGKRVIEMEFASDGSGLLLTCFDDTQVVDLDSLKSELNQLGLGWKLQ